MKRQFVLLLLLAFSLGHAQKRAVAPEDLFAVREIGDVRLSSRPGREETAVFTVGRTDRAKNRNFSNLWTVPFAGGPPSQLTTGDFADSMPRWSPDGRKIAFASDRGGKSSLWIIEVASHEMRMVAPWEHSNFFQSKAGEAMCWTAGSQIAFVAAEKPPAGRDQETDPRVISRIQYKSRTSFSDDLHSHIFLVGLQDGKVLQLTTGNNNEHSISCSPRGDEIAFLSNREPDPDANLNYDIYAVDGKTGKERRLTETPGVEMSPVWSPDGNFLAYTATKRLVTTIDSVAEDAHVWVIPREGGTGKEASALLDRRAGAVQWSADSQFVYFLAGDHGKTVLYGVPREGGRVQPVMDEPAQISSFALTPSGKVATIRSDNGSPGEVFAGLRRLTSFHQDLAGGWRLVNPETIRFKSFDGTEIEGWLIRPLDFQPGRKYPLILTIHGGPHGMFGYAFNLNNQVYAAHGYAVLSLNPRGSSGYGQVFSDGCVNDWGGGDYQDLMRGVEFVVAGNAWIDPRRLGVMGGSYGGYMTNWVITQTQRFRAAVALASLSNLISFYATSLYQDLVHTEFNGFPWDNSELLWRHSPMAHIKKVVTPTLFLHGEQDNDVHITQAEEMYMGLKRRNIEAVLVRYPREGHGVREPLHRLDQTHRILAWFDRFLR